MNLFSKVNDYNFKLEKVLDSKYFSSNIKSLLQSMTYKIENSYKDYKEVKHINKNQDSILEEIVEIINDYCDNIKLVEPGTKEAEIIKKHNLYAITNTHERSILAYPTEVSLLYAIIDILPKYFYVESTFLFKNAMQQVLVKGVNQNVVEILTDFNGWSWDINLNYKNDIIANLIYQNFLIIFGQEFMDSWLITNTTRKSSLVELKRKVKSTNYFLELCKYLYLISDKADRIKIEERYEFKKENKLNVAIRMQQEFAKYLVLYASSLEENEDIIKLIYQLRYYRELNISTNIKIKDLPKMEKLLDEVYKILITKACKNSIIRIVNNDINTNYKIIKNILDTKIINLDEIKIKLNLDTSKLIIHVYDGDVVDREITYEETVNKSDLDLKLNKKYKLFN